MVTLTCTNCGQEFERQEKQHKQAVKRGRKPFCSLACVGVYQRAAAESAICSACGNKFERSGASKGKMLYCSKSCSNRGRKSPTASNVCPTCVGVKSWSAQECRACGKKKRLSSSTTLREWRDKYNTSQYHAKVREHSRSVYKTSGKPYACQVCGYTTFVDIAHIKDVKDFDLDTPVMVVNSLGNLTALCPTHHREFDSGLITLS